LLRFLSKLLSGLHEFFSPCAFAECIHGFAIQYEPEALASPNYVPPQTGIYAVRLIVTDTDGSSGYKVKEEYITVANFADCPFEVSLDNQDQVVFLRTLRNKRFNSFYGRLLTSIFYKNSPEITSVLRANPDLQERLRQLVADNIDIAEKLIRTGKAALPESNLSEIITFINDIKSQGSPSLKFYSDLVIKGIEYGFLMDGIGINIE
jgi:PKD repeat protein